MHSGAWALVPYGRVTPTSAHNAVISANWWGRREGGGGCLCVSGVGDTRGIQPRPRCSPRNPSIWHYPVPHPGCPGQGSSGWAPMSSAGVGANAARPDFSAVWGRVVRCGRARRWLSPLTCTGIGDLSIAALVIRKIAPLRRGSDAMLGSTLGALPGPSRRNCFSRRRLTEFRGRRFLATPFYSTPVFDQHRGIGREPCVELCRPCRLGISAPQSHSP